MCNHCHCPAPPQFDILYELVTAEKAFVDGWAVKQHIEYQKRVALPETEHVTIKDEIEWAINQRNIRIRLC
jgi:hypothetical protein